MSKPTWNTRDEYEAEKALAWKILQEQVKAHDPERRMNPSQIRKFTRQFIKQWQPGVPSRQKTTL